MRCFVFLCITTRKFNQTATKPLEKGKKTRLQTIFNLNQPIPTSYEKVMVFGRWEKFREFLMWVSKFFFLERIWGKWKYLNGREREKKATNHGLPCQQPMWGTYATHGQRVVQVVWHTASTHGQPSLAFGLTCFSCAPLVFFGRIRASELWFWICLWITKYDSITHNKDYKT